jgi:hypothetical protein
VPSVALLISMVSYCVKYKVQICLIYKSGSQLWCVYEDFINRISVARFIISDDIEEKIVALSGNWRFPLSPFIK